MEAARISTRAGENGWLLVDFAGDWTLDGGIPSYDKVRRAVGSGVRGVKFEADTLGRWDSTLVAVALGVIGAAKEASVPIQIEALPEGVRELLDLAFAVPEREGARRTETRIGFFERIGQSVLDGIEGTRDTLAFLGEVSLSFARFTVGRARFRKSDFFLTLQECGASALPIVTLISLLVGMILAFVGAIQLRQFGAEIYVADLVAIGMLREMGAMMTAIIMAGRTGAAFAAQLGTMKVNEEIDALTTLGVPPMDFLVLPRMLALVLMMPLLCVYSDVVGIIGGMLVGISMLDLTATAYLTETYQAVWLATFFVGLFKAAVFGVLVAVAGCLRGLQCGNSSAAVGLAATSAVVTCIVAIVVSDAMITIICEVLGV